MHDSIMNCFFSRIFRDVCTCCVRISVDIPLTIKVGIPNISAHHTSYLSSVSSGGRFILREYVLSESKKNPSNTCAAADKMRCAKRNCVQNFQFVKKNHFYSSAINFADTMQNCKRANMKSILWFKERLHIWSWWQRCLTVILGSLSGFRRYWL